MTMDPIGIVFKELMGKTTDLIKQKLGSSEKLVSFLIKEGFDKPKDDFNVLYIHTLVTCKLNGAADPVLNIFRDKDVISAFEKAFQENDLQIYKNRLIKTVEQSKYGDEVKLSKADIKEEGEKFFNTFEKRSPAHHVSKNPTSC